MAARRIASLSSAATARSSVAATATGSEATTVGLLVTLVGSGVIVVIVEGATATLTRRAAVEAVAVWTDVATVV